MNQYKPTYYLLLSALFLFLTSCGTYKHAEKPLLNKNKVIVHGDKHGLEKDDIKSLITQKPNKKLIGFWRFKLWVYQLAEKKDTPFRQKLKNTFGEPPVFYEPQIVENTKQQIAVFLNKSGYFNSKVWVEHDFKKRKFNQFYHLQLTEPYTIRDYSYKISDSLIFDKVNQIKKESIISEGDIYNAYRMDDERDRITEHLKNRGYYNFSKEYIYFEVDSTLNNHQMDVTLNIKNIEEIDLSSSSGIIEKKHKQFTINRVFINQNYDLLNQTQNQYDTLLVNIKRDTTSASQRTYYFLSQASPRIKPKVIAQSVLIRPGEYFSLNNVRNTYRRLADLRNFKYTNIQFEEVSEKYPEVNKYLLDCYIQLSRAKTHAYSIELEGTNSGGNWGIGANLIYSNKNFFKGAELFEVKLLNSMEAQQINSDTETAGNTFLFFNTIETGIDVSLTFPKFLFPIRQEAFPQNFKPYTTLNFGLNYQQRPNYKRYIINSSFGYQWTQNKQTRHIFKPVEFSSVKVFPTSGFANTLDTITNERIKNQYTDHLIVGLSYTYTYNTQDIKKLKDFIYLRANFESSGFLLKGVQTLFKAPETENYNTLFNIRYAQYVRADVDFRFYKVFTADSRMVFRSMLGVGYPYGNSEDLPFEKGFFAGGANGMRGWGIRSLGPGSSKDEDNVGERIGDLRAEFNLEYRFPVYRILKGALFIDAGNIWRITNDVIPGSAFKMNNFFNELAMDAGLGFRFDFRFFVFRVDAALRLRDPANEINDRWVVEYAKFKKVVWNFGIGYPF